MCVDIWLKTVSLNIRFSFASLKYIHFFLFLKFNECGALVVTGLGYVDFLFGFRPWWTFWVCEMMKLDEEKLNKDRKLLRNLRVRFYVVGDWKI